MTKRALVTGGAGFIGSHVADVLLAHDYSVDVIDDLSSGDREHLPHDAAFHEMDVGSEAAADLVERGSFDVVCHLAAQMDVRMSVADPRFDAKVNIVGTLNLLEAVRRSARRTRFIFASTGGALYGDGAPTPTPEHVSKTPLSPYGVAKLAVEHYLAYYAGVQGLETVALRFGNVYGPRQALHGEAGVVAIFCKRIVAGGPLTVFGDGTQTRDYVYVADVARAHLAAATVALRPAADVDSRAFNLGTSVETDVNHLAALLAAAAKVPLALEHAPTRAGEQMRSVIDWSKAAQELAWRPQVSLRDGLASTYAWFAERATAAALSAPSRGSGAPAGSRTTAT
ncbi:MAG: SDR family oxidoreductase [Gemmatimonadaceae bacterium]